jgi:predicted Fe-Mo cluster-binding NifX family protein
MKVAVTATGADVNTPIDLRFGRAKYFILFDTDADGHDVIENTQNLQAAQGAGIQAGQNVVELGADALITGNVGPKAFRVLQTAGIKIYLCGSDTTVVEAVERLKAGDLQQVDQANVEGHWA